MDKQILLIEDDELLVKALYKVLNQYHIDTANTVRDALNMAKTKEYDLFIIDILLQGNDTRTGIDVCKEIRHSKISTPILIITAKHAINVKLNAFNNGVDDYLCKPFNMLEFRARVNSLTKRQKEQEIEKDLLIVGDLAIDQKEMTVKRSGEFIKLRRKEFAILSYLAVNHGKVLSKDALIDKFWELDVPNSNTIDVHIRHIRQQLDEPYNKKLLYTVHGIGYKLQI